MWLSYRLKFIFTGEEVSISLELCSPSDAIAEDVPNSFEEMEDDDHDTGKKNTSQDDILKLIDDMGDRLAARLPARISTNLVSQMGC